MITIPESVERIIRKSPYMEEALALGILNLSAVARLIRPEIEKETMKGVKDGAVIVSLNRLSRRILKKTKRTRSAFRAAPDLIVRSNLFEMTFANSDELPMKQKKLQYLTKFPGMRGMKILIIIMRLITMIFKLLAMDFQNIPQALTIPSNIKISHSMNSS